MFALIHLAKKLVPREAACRESVTSTSSPCGPGQTEGSKSLSPPQQQRPLFQQHRGLEEEERGYGVAALAAAAAASRISRASPPSSFSVGAYLQLSKLTVSARFSIQGLGISSLLTQNGTTSFLQN